MTRTEQQQGANHDQRAFETENHDQQGQMLYSLIRCMTDEMTYATLTVRQSRHRKTRATSWRLLERMGR